MKSSVFERLQLWYLSQCNEDWEHSFGVKIETLDNPGWLVAIDLNETEWEELTVARKVEQRSEHDWVQGEIANKKFSGACGPKNLDEVIELFFTMLEQRG